MQKNSSDQVEQLPLVGEQVESGSSIFTLAEAIGDGGYGVVYLAKDSENRKWALKAEKYQRSMLHPEIMVLRAANAANCRHFCKLKTFGAMKKQYTFIVMTLLGKDLHHLRCEMPGKKFSISTTLRIAHHSLRALEELHTLGFVSRDCKPGNLAPGIGSEKRTIFMYDFGLARMYVNQQGKVLPSRGEIGWRGTRLYGSINAHLCLELGRRDDLESWLYMLIEFCRGSLPWGLSQDRDDVHKSKMAARYSQRFPLFDGLPVQLNEMMTLIDYWTFETKPDYNRLFTLLESTQNSHGLRGNERWDWDDDTATTPTASPRRLSIHDMMALGNEEE